MHSAGVVPEICQDQVTVRVVPSSDSADEDAPGPLLTALTEEDGDFDFSMTNPPFFESEDEVWYIRGIDDVVWLIG